MKRSIVFFSAIIIMISALSSCSPKNSEDRVTTGEATVTQAETTDYSAVVRLTAQQAIEQCGKGSRQV